MHAWDSTLATLDDSTDAAATLLQSLLQGLRNGQHSSNGIIVTTDSRQALPAWFSSHFAIVADLTLPTTARHPAAILNAACPCPTLVQLALPRAAGLSCRNLARLAGYLNLQAGSGDEAAVVDAAFELLHTTRRAAFPVHVGATPWTAFAGYPALKTRLARVIDSLTAPPHPAYSLTPASGLLLHGPSGCGKTLLAQALITRSRLCCLSVRVTDILSRYLGETEANIRDLFRTARQLQPCIVLLDNVECLVAQRRTDSSTGTGVEERALSQLLNEMDGIEPAQNVFYIGTTSAPLSAIDAAALRPGKLACLQAKAVRSTSSPLGRAL